MKRLRGVDVPSARRRPNVPKPRAGTSADSADAKVRTSSPRSRARARVHRGANCPGPVSNYTADRVASRARTPFVDPSPNAAPSKGTRARGHRSTTPAHTRARLDQLRVRRIRKTAGKAAIRCRPATRGSPPPPSTRSAAGRRRHRRNRWCRHPLPARNSPLPTTSSRALPERLPPSSWAQANRLLSSSRPVSSSQVRGNRLSQSRPRPSRKRCATRRRAPS